MKTPALLFITLALAGVAVPAAWSQTKSPSVAIYGPTQASMTTMRLDDMAAKIHASNRTAPRVATFDVAWPADVAEFTALGRNAVLQISAVVHDPRDLPIRQVFVRTAGGDVPLTKLSETQRPVVATSVLASTVGAYRDDVFYLVPADLLLNKGEIMVDFAQNRTDFPLGDAPITSPDFLVATEAHVSSAPNAGALKLMLAREYPGWDFSGVAP